jgi:hypothetical protein
MRHPEIVYFDETLYNNWAITKIKTVKVSVALVFKPGTTTP